MPQLANLHKYQTTDEINLPAPALPFNVAKVHSWNCSNQIIILKGCSSSELTDRMSKGTGSEKQTKSVKCHKET